MGYSKFYKGCEKEQYAEQQRQSERGPVKALPGARRKEHFGAAA